MAEKVYNRERKIEENGMRERRSKMRIGGNKRGKNEHAGAAGWPTEHVI